MLRAYYVHAYASFTFFAVAAGPSTLAFTHTMNADPSMQTARFTRF